MQNSFTTLEWLSILLTVYCETPAIMVELVEYGGISQVKLSRQGLTYMICGGIMIESKFTLHASVDALLRLGDRV
jgi:hypothetical protein